MLVADMVGYSRFAGAENRDLLSALMLALLAHPAGEHEWMGEDALQMASPLILRMMSRVTRRPFKRPGLI